MVFLDGQLAGTLSPFEREIELDGACTIAIELSPNDYFGMIPVRARLRRACVVQPNHTIRALCLTLMVSWETCAQLSDHDAAARLIHTMDETLARVRIPSNATVVLRRLAMLRQDLKLNLGVARSLDHHYHYQTPLRAIERLLEETQHLDASGLELSAVDTPEEPEGVAEALEYLTQRLSDLVQRFPPEGQLAATAHAHLDVAWLWPLTETRRKIRHTFANVLTLMDRYPDFYFTASSAQLYAYVQHDDPALFERVRQRIAEGRIEPIGGMWLEPDGNLPSGEAFVRHLLFGQRYFMREFGRSSSVAWMPDTFGLTANLPQILASGGMRSFFTQKLNWNDTNQFPFDLWQWEGLDGTRLVAHSFHNPIGGYNAQITPEALNLTWGNFRGKRRHAESLFAFGMGDGGRGPTSEMLERTSLLRSFPVLPSLRQTTVEEFFERINSEDLPVWLGELYLEFHRGTYTTQSRLKRLNRQAEHRLYEAETLATLAFLSGADYPKDVLDDCWTTLLRNQFHDILPGSSIREVNEQAERELTSVVQHAIAIRDGAIDCLARQSDSSDDDLGHIAVFNPQGFARPLSCETTAPPPSTSFKILADDGREIPWQPLDDQRILIHDTRTLVPGTGQAALAVVDGNPSSAIPGVWVNDSTLENDLVRVTIANDGTIGSFFDKRVGRNILVGPGNQLRTYHDLPSAWEAWNLTDTSALEGTLLGSVESIRVAEHGPLRAVIEIERSFAGSQVTQRYMLRAGSARLDIRTEIDWHERRTLLRALFPLAVRSAHATFETSYGAVERPTHRNTSWDAAKFEVPGHRWAELSEPGFGVSLLNDGRYGHSALGNTLGITLLRSPLEPDPLADLGKHEFTYSLLPHLGGWHDGGTLSEAIDLNSPLLARTLNARAHGTGDTSQHQWIRVEAMTLGALKRAEDSDDIVVRVYDPFGRHGVAQVTPGFPITQARLVNLLEETESDLAINDGGVVRFPFRPFQIITLLLTR